MAKCRKYMLIDYMCKEADFKKNSEDKFQENINFEFYGRIIKVIKFRKMKFGMKIKNLSWTAKTTRQTVKNKIYRVVNCF